jgi:hypothetical protein
MRGTLFRNNMVNFNATRATPTVCYHCTATGSYSFTIPVYRKQCNSDINIIINVLSSSSSSSSSARAATYTTVAIDHPWLYNNNGNNNNYYYNYNNINIINVSYYKVPRRRPDVHAYIIMRTLVNGDFAGNVLFDPAVIRFNTSTPSFRHGFRYTNVALQHETHFYDYGGDNNKFLLTTPLLM